MAFYNQPSFAAGEIGPHLYGRVDQELYYIGLRTCKNFIIRQYGGATNRSGTKFIAELKDHTKKGRLIPFDFNEIQSYVMVLGDETLRLIKDQGEVVNAAVTITGITNANPAVVTAAAHGYSNGDDVFLKGIVGMVELNNRSLRVKNVAANTFEITDYLGNNINTTNYAAYVSGGTAEKIYTVATPWDSSDLFELSYAQSNDVLTVCNQKYYPRDVTRTAHNAWTITSFPNQEGPFKDINTGVITVYASAATGTGITITASATLFDATMVGELFYIEQKPGDTTARWEAAKAIGSTGLVKRAGSHYYSSATTGTTGTFRPDHTEGSATDGDPGVRWDYLHSGFGIVRITAQAGTTATADVIKRLPDLVVGSGNATALWAKAAWSETEGYPATAAYSKQRFNLGGTKLQPNGLWMSGANQRSFFGKSNPILDDESISLLLDTTQAVSIRHLIPLSELIVLTSTSEQLINGVENVISAVDLPNSRVQGYTGSSKVRPIIINNTALFIEDLSSVIRSLQYQFDSDSFGGIDLTARSPHLFEGKRIVDWAYARYPFSVIWVVLDDGSLLGFTFMQEQQVYAWHRHETDGLVESVCSIREGNESAVYFIVKRTINGNTKRYVERMASRRFTNIRDAYFVDCGLSYDGRNTGSTTITIGGGTNWDDTETLTLTASSAIFLPVDVGNQIVYWSGKIAYRLTITAHTSGTVVSAVLNKSLPVAYQNLPRTDWEFARKVFRPLEHIEGKAVAVLADGNVVNGLSVIDGAVTLGTPAAVVHIGLPYTADLETLDFAQPQGQNKVKPINIPRLFLTVQETRSVFAGINGFDDLKEVKGRDVSLGYDLPVPAITETLEVYTNSSWSRLGRIAIRQSNPLPMTINCITPEVQGGYN
jgi:hypothetical protein